MELPLQADEREALRSMRVNDLLTFEQIGTRIGVHERTIHRILTIDDYQPSELVTLQIRAGLRALAEKARKRTGTRG